MRKIAFTTIAFILFLLFLEVLFRGYLLLFPTHPHQIKDDQLGWKIRPNVQLTLAREGVGEVHYSTVRNGFRKYGNITSSKKKIFIVGDSYTESIQMSDGLCFYDYLDTTQFELFVYGCSAYGTLQEYLVLERHVAEIQPDLILVQYCYNDLTNNTYDLDIKSNFNNYLMRKPYWINDEIQYKFPHESPLISFLDSHSKIALWTHLKWLNYLSKRDGSLEQKLEGPDIIFPEAVKTTSSLYAKIKNLGYPMAVISVYTEYGQEEIESICDQLEISYLSNVEKVQSKLVNKGMKINYAPYDWHWNKLGHKTVGKCLQKELKAIYSSSL